MLSARLNVTTSVVCLCITAFSVLKSAALQQGFYRENAASLTALHPWYHTSAELRSEAARLANASTCKDMLTLETIQGHGVSIDVITVRQHSSAVKSNRVFILFGEHPRELISPESGLYLLKALCGEVPALQATDVLAESEFQIVLNGNPRSRLRVENGEFCVRENPDGVDLNRNWDEHWSNTSATPGDGTNPGDHPFSEPETRILKQLVSSYKPTTFLTVHSGTRGLYMPWAYDTKHLAHRNQPAMLRILKQLDADHCECPYGAAGKEVGYACPGTCLDWAYDEMNTPYAFAFEIYVAPEYDASLKERWQEKLDAGGALMLLQGSNLGHPHFLDLFQRHSPGSDFVQHSWQSSNIVHSASAHAHYHSRGLDNNMSCFRMFNPETKELYDSVVLNWAGAYLDMARAVAADLRANDNSTSSSNSSSAN